MYEETRNELVRGYSRYKYPLKSPAVKAGAKWNEQMRRKHFRQWERILDRSCKEEVPENFHFTVAEVKVGTHPNWRWCFVAPESGYEKQWGKWRRQDLWKSYDEHGPLQVHIFGPKFATVLRVDENEGLEELLPEEAEIVPEYFQEKIQRKIEQLRESSYKNVTLNYFHRLPIFGLSEEGQKLAMDLQSEYNVPGENIHLPE